MEQLEQYGQYFAASNSADVPERADPVDGTNRARDSTVVRAVRRVQIVHAYEEILIRSFEFARSSESSIRVTTVRRYGAHRSRRVHRFIGKLITRLLANSDSPVTQRHRITTSSRRLAVASPRDVQRPLMTKVREFQSSRRDLQLVASSEFRIDRNCRKIFSVKDLDVW